MTDAFVTLPLSQLHNVTTITLEACFTRRNKILCRLSDPELNATNPDPITYTLSSFKHLGELHVRNSYKHWQESGGQSYQAFFTPPALETLSVSGLYSVNTARFSSTAVSAVSTSLTLCHTRERQLGKILQMTPHLRRLQYDWTYWDRTRTSCGNAEIIDVDAMTHSLEQAPKSLKELIIHAKIQDRSDEYQDHLPILGSLERLAHITKPGIPQSAHLLPWHIQATAQLSDRRLCTAQNTHTKTRQRLRLLLPEAAWRRRMG